MKKTSFYSMVHFKGRTKAMLRNGYTDGTFYYFRDERYCNTWNAIHPLCGLSVAAAYTRKECAEIAHSLDVLQRISTVLEERGAELTKAFERAVTAAKLEV